MRRILVTKADQIKQQIISSTGLSESAINAAWPEWWSEAADASLSAQTELRFSLARKLGLSPSSVLEDQTPTFVWDDTAKFKNLDALSAASRSAITAFGCSIGRLLLNACEATHSLEGLTATHLRSLLLKSHPHVGLIELLKLLWGVGVPTIHLRVYPLSAKRMCAMAVKVNQRHAILLVKDATYPAPIAFHLAHEIGHIALKHLQDNHALVDMEDPAEVGSETDQEEIDADEFALTLLTGMPKPDIRKVGSGKSARQLAAEALKLGQERQIEPGTLALCFGHATKEWAVTQKALQYIYSDKPDAWRIINIMAKDQLQWDHISEDSASYIRAVLGGI